MVIKRKFGLGTQNIYTADVVSYSDYSPYGTLLDGRHGEQNGSDYRYGFNGMEKDDEIKNISGSSYTTHFRMLDPRIGRWFSIDPVFQPWQSPYTSMDNNPIRLNVPLGNVANDRGKKSKPKTYNNPEKAAKKYCKERGWNAARVHLEQDGDGSIQIIPNITTVMGKEVWGPNFRASKWATKQFRKKMQADYEAEKEREYNNTNGMFRNFDFNHGIGGVSNTAYTEGSATDEVRAQWEYHRANVAAVDDLAYNMMKYTTYGVVGGVMFMELGVLKESTL